MAEDLRCTRFKETVVEMKNRRLDVVGADARWNTPLTSAEHRKMRPVRVVIVPAEKKGKQTKS